MKKSVEKINNSAFASNAFGITEEGSNKAVKKFRSLEDISIEQRRRGASQPLYLYRYE
ncbi:MAG: hypothetical protein ABSD73_03040 [Candidatus Bathyarchaeia archaeon]